MPETGDRQCLASVLALGTMMVHLTKHAKLGWLPMVAFEVGQRD